MIWFVRGDNRLQGIVAHHIIFLILSARGEYKPRATAMLICNALL